MMEKVIAEMGTAGPLSAEVEMRKYCFQIATQLNPLAGMRTIMKEAEVLKDYFETGRIIND